MEIMYKSTRGSKNFMTSSQAIIKGLSEDGGLYIPDTIPKIDKSFKELKDYNYKELCYYILNKYLTDFNEKELKECINNAYDNKFDSEEEVVLKGFNDSYFLELYHGPTLAFKDMALSILPYLLKTSLKKNNIEKEVVILTATSGDTGKAALEGFAEVENTKIIVFYPQDGVSDIQKRQMITQKGDNTFVIGIDGNFDDAQRGVKEIFNDKELEKILEENNYILSSANSINIGRLLPQVVYYFYAYLKLLKNNEIEENEKINVSVPTGNFGNILAAYFAREMGLPINKFICASNENNVLYNYMNTGIYDIKRDFKITISPSMDILVSSNLERLNYYLCEEDSNQIKKIMGELSANGKYKLEEGMKSKLSDFYGGYAKDQDTIDSISYLYKEYGYLIDTHTAVAYFVNEKYKKESGDKTKTIIASTASPFKFTRSVAHAIGIEGTDDFNLVNEVSLKTGLKVQQGIKGLENREVLHKKSIKKNDLKKAICQILKV